MFHSLGIIHTHILVRGSTGTKIDISGDFVGSFLPSYVHLAMFVSVQGLGTWRASGGSNKTALLSKFIARISQRMQTCDKTEQNETIRKPGN